MDWTDLDKERNRWWADENVVKKPQTSIKCAEFSVWMNNC